ncbi:MAG: ATP-binding cassette domain-containing protein [Thermoguttaceae bacterium]|nr:ATP-binding cassette domain-containing protein [Thermoguttaceae bacterium]
MNDTANVAQVGEIILRAENLNKSFSKGVGKPRIRAVHQASFEVRRGEIVGLLGGNGAGKSTSFRMICGLLQPDAGSGRVLFHKRGAKPGELVDVARLPMYLRVKAGMGYLPQHVALFESMTIDEHFKAAIEYLVEIDGVAAPGKNSKRARKKDLEKRAEELIYDFKLERRRDSKVGGSSGGLSGGEKRKLEFALALLANPTIILLDEPFAALDPKIVETIQETILYLAREQNVGVLITDHKADVMFTLADRVYIFHNPKDGGRIVCEGSPEEVLKDERSRVYVSDFEARVMLETLGDRRDDLAERVYLKLHKSTAASRVADVADEIDVARKFVADVADEVAKVALELPNGKRRLAVENALAAANAALPDVKTAAEDLRRSVKSAAKAFIDADRAASAPAARIDAERKNAETLDFADAALDKLRASTNALAPVVADAVKAAKGLGWTQSWSAASRARRAAARASDALQSAQNSRKKAAKLADVAKSIADAPAPRAVAAKPAPKAAATPQKPRKVENPPEAPEKSAPAATANPKISLTLRRPRG